MSKRVDGNAILQIALQNEQVTALNPGLLAEKQATRGKGKGNRYNAVGEYVDGHWFSSGVEARRYCELKLLQRAGVISGLVPHPKFSLHAGVTYTPDFQYVEDGRTVVEDVKGGDATKTQSFIDKWKMVQEKYPDLVWRIEER